jgi:hypothetical protein
MEILDAKSGLSDWLTAARPIGALDTSLGGLGGYYLTC